MFKCSKYNLIYLDTGMGTQVKVKLSWMTDAHVDNGTGWNVATLANFVAWVFAEESKKRQVRKSTFEYFF